MDIAECLTDEAAAVLHGPLWHWCGKIILPWCPICDQELDEDDMFVMYREMSPGDPVLWGIGFHYECAIKEEYCENFRENQLEGFWPE